MSIRPRTLKPWPQNVSVWSQQFHDLINKALEDLTKLIKLQAPILRIIREHKRKDQSDLSTVVRATITAVSADEFNATYSAESPGAIYTTEDATPINRWANFAFVPAAIGALCEMQVDPGSGEVLGLVVWETPDDTICAVPPPVPV